MSISKKFFGKANGEDVYLYTITNKNSRSVSLQTLGAGIQSLCVADRNGNIKDVVLGFDSPSEYVNPDNGYQGLVVGRWANRIRSAKFIFQGKEYNTPNNQGSWTLHSGGRFSFTTWDVDETTHNSITFSRFSPDGEDGFGGNLNMKVKYTFTDDDTLRVEYIVVSDKDTVANPTNHAYFNLSGENETIENHTLYIDADYFTETDGDQLPTGTLGRVKNTMMDFTYPHKIGDKIDEPFRAVIDSVGYDNNYCLNKEYGEFSLAAQLYDEKSGRMLSVYTDLPGIQLYCGGWLDKNASSGKSNCTASYRKGVALETQFFPDSVNHGEFPWRYVRANKEFKTVTEFRFSVK